MVMVANTPADATTVTDAVPEIAPLVARIVFGNTPAVAPAVKTPDVLPIVPPPLITVQVTAGEIATTTPFASLPVAVNVCEPLTGILPAFAVMAMVVNAPLVPTTVTEASVETVPLVTLIVCEYVPAAAPAVNTPVLLLIVPPPFTTDQVGVSTTALPLAS